MSKIDYQAIREGIVQCAREAYQSLRNTHPTDVVYLFDLYCSEDVDGFNLQVNTLDALESAKDSSDADERWRPICKHELSGPFRSLDPKLDFEMLEELGFDDDQIRDHKGRVLASAVLALAQLKNEGLFADNPGGQGVVQVCSIPDSDWTEWLELESSKRCNSKEELVDYNAYWLYPPKSNDSLYPSFIDELVKNGQSVN